MTMNTYYCLKCQITVNRETCIQCGDKTRPIDEWLLAQIDQEHFLRRPVPAIRVKSGGRETRI
jgi:hypothetical protein